MLTKASVIENWTKVGFIDDLTIQIVLPFECFFTNRANMTWFLSYALICGRYSMGFHVTIEIVLPIECFFASGTNMTRLLSNFWIRRWDSIFHVTIQIILPFESLFASRTNMTRFRNKVWMHRWHSMNYAKMTPQVFSRN